MLVRNIAVVLHLVALIGVGYCVFEIQSLKNTAAQKMVNSEGAGNRTFVLELLEEHESRKQRKEIDSRLSGFSLAAPQIETGKHIYGNPDARFTLVEFSDLKCPYCQRFHATAKSVVDNSDGEINWQWLHFPLAMHNPDATTMASASECISEQSGNRVFWAYLDALFSAPSPTPNSLAQLGEEFGADKTSLQRCIESGKYESLISDHVARGSRYGVTGTPGTFVVDNLTGRSQLMSGAQPAKALLTLVQAFKNEGKSEKQKTPTENDKDSQKGVRVIKDEDGKIKVVTE